jgi:hypothetical protein
MKKLFLIFVVLFLVFLTGCGQEDDQYKDQINQSFDKLSKQKNFNLSIIEDAIVNYDPAKTVTFKVQPNQVNMLSFSKREDDKSFKGQSSQTLGREEFLNNLNKMVSSLIEQTDSSYQVKELKVDDAVVSLYCLSSDNKSDKMPFPAVKINPVDLNYYNPFIEQDQVLKEAALIEFCYRQDNKMPQSLSFSSKNIGEYFKDQTAKNVEDLSFSFNYPGRG